MNSDETGINTIIGLENGKGDVDDFAEIRDSRTIKKKSTRAAIYIKNVWNETRDSLFNDFAHDDLDTLGTNRM